MLKHEYKIPEKETTIAAAKVALVAILETLYVSNMAFMHNGWYNQRREMFGMSIANIACGLMGGIPASGVMVYTNVNVECGAYSRMSQFVSSVLTFLMVITLSQYWTYMPMACISAVLLACYFRFVRP